MERTLQIAPFELWLGDRSIFNRPAAAILNSRQSKYPIASDKWITSTIDAVTWACRKDYSILTGFGMKTWELVLWASGEVLGPVIALVPVPVNLSTAAIGIKLQSILKSFKLVQQNCLLIPYFVKETQTEQKAEMHLRDDWIVNKADVLVPVSVRKKGYFENVLNNQDHGKEVISDFLEEYSPKKYSFPDPPASESVEKCLSGIEWNYITHWTRSVSSPWPGEYDADYYRELATANGVYPRTAFDTLKNILGEGIIRATSWRMPAARPMVSLTEKHPKDIVDIMIWRSKLVRPNFEFYGIAIEKEELKKYGARQVIYGTVEDRKLLSLQDRLYFQTLSKKGANWPEEEEWRYNGNLELTGINPEKMIVLVRNSSEKEKIEKSYPIKTIAVEGSD